MNYPKAYLYQRMAVAKLFIDANFDQPIDVDEVAKEANFSKFHFIRLFQKCYGITPHKYLVNLRIKKAKKLLREGSTISLVCMDVGFQSLSTFTGLFSREVGVSPSRFRSECRARQTLSEKAPAEVMPLCFARRYGLLEE